MPIRLACIAIALALACGCDAANRTTRVSVSGALPPGMHLPIAAADAIIGVVVDGAGAPVAGAEVTFAPYDARTAGAGLQFRADAQGMLRGALPAGEYKVQIQGVGLLGSTVERVLWPADALQFVAARAVGIAGQVVDGDHPLPGATVVVVRDNVEEFSIAADAEGRFAFAGLAQGTYRVYAYAGDLVARSRLVEQRGTEESLRLVLAVEPGTIIAGAVRDDDTSQGVPASVLLMAVGHEEPPRLVQTNRLGEFRLEGVPRGRWQIAAAAPAYLTSTPLDITQTMASGAPLAIRIARGEELRVRVLDRSGTPIAAASLWLQSENDRENAASFADAVRALGQGALQLSPRAELGVTSGPVPLIPRTPLPAAMGDKPTSRVYVATVGEVAGLSQRHLSLPAPGGGTALVTDGNGEILLTGLQAQSWRVVAQHPNFVDSEAVAVVLPRPSLDAVTLVLSAGGVIKGRVVNSQGAPLAGVLVTWQPPKTNANNAIRRAVTDAQGNVVMKGLVGKGTLLASAAGIGEASTGLELNEGETVTPTLVIAEQRGAVYGVVVDQAGNPVPGAQVGIGAGGRSAIADGQGAFLLQGVADGLLALRASHRNYLPLELQVRGDAGVPQRLVLASGAQLHVTVLDRHTGMPVAGATAVMAQGNSTMRATSDNQGQLEFRALAKGAWRLTLAVPGYVDVRREVVLADDKQNERVEFERGAMVSGVVRDRYGGRLARVRVKVLRATDGVAVESLTNADGAFILRNTPTGEVELAASAAQGKASEIRTLRPGDEVTSIELTLR